MNGISFLNYNIFLFRAPYVPQTFLRGSRRKNGSPSVMEHLLTNTNNRNDHHKHAKRIIKITQQRPVEKATPEQKSRIQSVDLSSPVNNGKEKPRFVAYTNPSPPSPSSLSHQIPPEVHLPSLVRIPTLDRNRIGISNIVYLNYISDKLKHV